MLQDTDYPLIYLEHFQNPRNVGICDHPTHRAEGSVPQGTGCFDHLVITLEIKNNRIEQTRFYGRLCSGSLAAASLLMTLIEDKSIAEIQTFSAETLSALWGAIPPGKAHSLTLAIGTLHLAIKSPL